MGNATIKALAFTPNGRGLLIGTLQYQPEQAVGTLKMWDLPNRTFDDDIDTHEGEPVEALMFPPKGRVSGPSIRRVVRRAMGRVNTESEILFNNETDDATKAKSYSRRLVSVKLVRAVAFSPDGKTLSGRSA